MTDPHHDSHGHSGGHEIDAPPTRELFNIVWGLGALTLLSLVTCVQLFNNQARDLGAERGKEGSYVLSKYRQDMEARTRAAGKDAVTDAQGQVVARYDYIPLASARDLILAKPEKLGAFPPPQGWIHPDDVAAGGQGASATPSAPATPPPAEPPAEGAAAPAEGAPPLPAGATAPDVPLDVDKGQPESSKPIPGGTPTPIGQPPAGADSPAPPAAPTAPTGVLAPEGTPNAQPEPVGDR